MFHENNCSRCRGLSWFEDTKSSLSASLLIQMGKHYPNLPCSGVVQQQLGHVLPTQFPIFQAYERATWLLYKGPDDSCVQGKSSRLEAEAMMSVYNAPKAYDIVKAKCTN